MVGPIVPVQGRVGAVRRVLLSLPPVVRTLPAFAATAIATDAAVTTFAVAAAAALLERVWRRTVRERLWIWALVLSPGC